MFGLIMMLALWLFGVFDLLVCAVAVGFTPWLIDLFCYFRLVFG